MQATGQQDGSVQHELLAVHSIQGYMTGGARALRQSLGRAAHVTAGWWLVGLLEGVTGIVIVTLVGATIPGQWGLLRVQPHPLWIVVLAIALRYGRGAGYAIGASSALAYGILEYLRPEARLSPLAAHDLMQPFLLLAGGVLIGEFAHAHYCRQAAIEERCESATTRTSELDGRYQALRAAHTELERRIIGQPASVATVHEAAKMLRVLRPADLYPAVLDVLARLVEAEAVALYLKRDGRYELQAGHPADRPGRPFVVVAAGNENATGETVIERALRSRTVVTIRDLILDAGPIGVIDEPVLMAGPVLTAEGDVRAVVVVERLPFLRLAPDTVELFRVILDWVAMALDNAERYERASAGMIVEEATGLYSTAYTVALLERERSRARRHGTAISTVVVRAENLQQAAPSHRAAAERALAHALMERVRAEDVLVRDTTQGVFMLILPTTLPDGAEALANRLTGIVLDDDGSQLTLHAWAVGALPGVGDAEPAPLAHPAVGKLVPLATPTLSTAS